MTAAELTSWDDVASDASTGPSFSRLLSTCSLASDLPSTTCSSARDVPRQKKRLAEKTRIMFAKTEMCRYFEQGMCRRGEACSFAHGTDELQVRPNFTNTTMCIFWAKNRCNKGDACEFAHGKEELRDAPDTTVPMTSRAKRPSDDGVPVARSDPQSKSSVTLPEAPQTSTSTAPATQSHCPRCITLGITANAHFCVHCGGALVSGPMPSKSSTQPGAHKLLHARRQGAAKPKRLPLTAPPEEATAAVAAGAVSPEHTWCDPTSWWHTSSLSEPILMPVLVDFAYVSSASQDANRGSSHADVDSADLERLGAPGGVTCPYSGDFAGYDPHSLANMLTTMAQQQEYED